MCAAPVVCRGDQHRTHRQAQALSIQNRGIVRRPKLLVEPRREEGHGSRSKICRAIQPSRPAATAIERAVHELDIEETAGQGAEPFGVGLAGWIERYRVPMAASLTLSVCFAKGARQNQTEIGIIVRESRNDNVRSGTSLGEPNARHPTSPEDTAE